MNVPEDLRYSSDHECARVEGGSVRMGITVYVQLPDLGTTVARGESFSEVESTKSVSNIYAPVTGTVTDVNADLGDAPQRLNDDPYGEGWLCVIEPSDKSELDELLDAEGYTKLIEG